MLYELTFAIAASGGVGWAIAKGSDVIAIVLALIVAVCLAAMRQGYQRDMRAVRSWRQMRWDELQRLTTQYRIQAQDNFHRDYQEAQVEDRPTLANLNERWAHAEHRAEKEIHERFGPIL
jgi:hypothetical protein